MKMADRPLLWEWRAVIDRIAALPVDAARQPRLPVTRCGGLRERQQFIDELLRVRLEPHGEAVNAVEFGKLRRVHVDHDLLRMTAELRRIMRRHDIVQPCADRDDEIGILHGEIWRAQRNHARFADAEWMVRRDEIGRVPGRHDRDLQCLVEHLELRRRFRQPYAVPGQNDRPLGGRDQFHDASAIGVKP